jgi:cytochrome c553
MKRIWLLLALVSVALLGAESATKNGPPANAAAHGQPARFGFGRAATAEEIARWDIAIRPDGRGLPPGKGTAGDGAPIYLAKCAACHGLKGEGIREQRAPRLISQPGDVYDFGVGKRDDDLKTIGSYWPYATTVFDYVRRAMPSLAPGSLTADEVYALTAFLLAKNGLIAETQVIDAKSLPQVRMPAQSHFVPDDRLETNKVR